jgi:gliding motility-associated-like protein
MKQILIILLSPIMILGHENITKIKYIENKGQWNSNIIYKANIPEGTVFIEKNSLTYYFYSSSQIEEFQHLSYKEKNNMQDLNLDGFAYKIELLEANKKVLITGLEQLTEYHNYFIGNNKKKWRGKVPIYNTVKYTSIYNGIDLKIYSSETFLKYDFIIAKGANPNDIKLYYNGAVPELKDEKLIIDIGFNTIVEKKPIAYQIINGVREEVDCRFLLKNNVLSFVFPKGYNKDYELIIDPILITSTLSGTISQNYGHTSTFGNNGEIFSGAISFGTGYPTTLGAFQVNYGLGLTDIAISKLNSDGSSLIWATYLGGSSDDYPHSMFANNNNELYMYGSTNSANYPTSLNAFQSSNGGGSDIAITHLTEDGSNIIGSTYIGGNGLDGRNNISTNYGDVYRGEIIVDNIGNAYVASFSSSFDFPTTNGVFQPFNSGGQDGVVCKFNPTLTTLEWATYLGSSGDDASYGLRVDDSNNVFVTGAASVGFPTTSSSAIQNFIGGSHDGFISKLSPQGTSLLASSFFGSVGKDESFFIDIDSDNDIYIYGQNSNFIPITTGCYGIANSNQFISKFNVDLTNIEWQTTIGSGLGSASGYDFIPIAFMVDICKNIYTSGHAGFANTIPSMFTTPNAFYTSGGFYLMTLDPNATNVNFATYYANADHVDGGTSRFDPSGKIYQAVCSGSSSQLITTNNAYSTTQTTGWDVGVFKIDFDLINFASAIGSPGISGCAPYTVNFINSSTGNQFFWDFDDNGQTSTAFNPTYTFNNTGTYDVMLIATDSSSCNIKDTAIIQINVLPSTIVSTSYATACNNYIWNGVIYTQSGIYSNVISTANCDSTIILDLIINNPTNSSNTINSCTPVSWNGQTYTSSGTYTYQLLNSNGCDSIATLNLSINSLITSYDTIISCTPISWNGQTYTNSGIYSYQTLNSNGCDSIINLYLSINSATMSTSTINACTSIIWNGTTFTNSGTYTYQTLNSNGCDSIATLYLLIDAAATSTNTIKSCIPIIWNGTTYTNSGTYTYQTINVNGCDSIATIDLTINSSNTSFSTVIACDSFYWNGETYTSSNTFNWEGLNTNGCDSVAILNLTIKNGTENTSKIIECDSYIWPMNNQKYTESGTYTNISINTAGCDSISKLVLRIENRIFLIPNSFTPNNDEHNDIFKVVSTEKIENNEYFEIYIYDRWGKEIYYSNDIEKFWDGTLDGNFVQHGVYVWKIKYLCNSKIRHKIGTVTLVN